MHSVDSLVQAVKLRRPLPPPAERRAIRQRAGISQAAIAAALGCSTCAVTRWEQGSRMPRDESRQRYAELLARLTAITPGDGR